MNILPIVSNYGARTKPFSNINSFLHYHYGLNPDYIPHAFIGSLKAILYE